MPFRGDAALDTVVPHRIPPCFTTVWGGGSPHWENLYHIVDSTLLHYNGKAGGLPYLGQLLVPHGKNIGDSTFRWCITGSQQNILSLYMPW